MRGKRKPEVVVVTGASAGVGRAVAHAFARRGAHVGLLARGEEGLEGARREVESLGGRALVVPTDVADPDAGRGGGRRGRAGARPDRRVGERRDGDRVRPLPRHRPRRVQARDRGDLSRRGATARWRRCERMLPRDRGTVVQVGSALAYRAIPLQSAYCGAKFAIRGFTDSVRTELLHDGIQVWITMVQLPAVNTPQFGWCEPAAGPPAAGAADLPAGGGRGGHRLGRAPSPPRARRRRQRGQGDLRQQAVARVSPTGTSPAPASRRSRSSGLPVNGRPDNLFEPVPAEAATTACSTTAPGRGATSCGPTRTGGRRRRRREPRHRRGGGLAGRPPVTRQRVDLAPARRTPCANTRSSPTASAASS